MCLHRTSYPLPQELTGLVVANLATDILSLQATSLVSKSWSAESSLLLFRELTLIVDWYRQDKSPEFLDLVRSSERVSKNIRTLQLNGTINFQAPADELYAQFSFDRLLQILAYLPQRKGI